ncbi:MAG: methyltransferase domain-containing protein [Gammaproteobacteria bacterium]
MTNFWNAKVYSQFLDLRTRPARDLLSVIPNSFQPKTVYDLGCGPGNSTILLKDRWPHAKIIGLDSSLDMLEQAKTSYPDIHFIEGDIAHFSPVEKIDCLLANASLQWLDQHEILIPKLLQFINPGGAFGIQMPNNFHVPTHQLTIKLLQSKVAWQPFLKNMRYGILTEPLYKPLWYYDLLTKSGANSLQLWETEYFHEMADYQEIFDWMKGTGLRPVFSTMDTENQAQFTSAYIKAIARAYPLQANNKILMPFNRIFMVGFK